MLPEGRHLPNPHAIMRATYSLYVIQVRIKKRFPIKEEEKVLYEYGSFFKNNDRGVEK